MVVELQNIRGKICSGGEKIPLSGELDIPAGEKTSLAESEFGDQGAVILESDTVLVIRIEASESPDVMIPQYFCFGRADRKTLALSEVGHRYSLFAGRGSNLVVAGKVTQAAVI